MHSVISFILSGGRGAGLYPLTRTRSAPAVTVAGKYRLIDIPISNCINSGMQRVYVLTQFLSVSLHRHISDTYSFSPFSRGFVQVLPAQQTNEATDWYKGTADALRQNLRYLKGDEFRDVMILSGDGLYRMDLADMVSRHRARKADLTIAGSPVPASRASSYGLLRTDVTGQIKEMAEKPTNPTVLDSLRLTTDWKATQGVSHGDHLANMGIYLCRREFLVSMLEKHPEAHDLVTQLFAAVLGSHRVYAHVFTGFWNDLGSSIAAYHEANLALAGPTPPFDFNSPDGVIYTRMRYLPAAQIRSAEVTNSLLSDGNILMAGTTVHNSVVGQRLRISEGAQVRDTVLCGANRFETQQTRQANRAVGVPDIGVGPGSVLSRCIVDKDCRIGANVRIVNANGVAHHDGENHFIRDGIVVIPMGTTIPDGTVI